MGNGSAFTGMIILELGVWRNGKRQSLEAAPLYNSTLVNAEWGAGVLAVTTPGANFRCEVDETGKVRFE